MKFMEYQLAARRTAPSLDGLTCEEAPRHALLSNAGLGLAGEAGECADVIKKIIHHGRPLDDAMKKRLALEAGDVLWYISLLCDLIGIDMETAAKMNVDKLKARFPDGFNHEDAARKRDQT